MFSCCFYSWLTQNLPTQTPNRLRGRLRPGCLRLLCALGATTVEMHLVGLNLKIVRIEFGPRQLIQRRIFHINNPPALQTDEVMMPAELRVESRGGAGMAGLGYQSQRNKCIQNPMNRHSRHVRQAGADDLVKPLRSRMIPAAQDRFKYRTPLGGYRQPAGAMCRQKMFPPLPFFRRLHDSRITICTR